MKNIADEKPKVDTDNTNGTYKMTNSITIKYQKSV